MNNVFQITKPPRKRRAPEDGRDRFYLFPRNAYKDQRYVYAFGLQNGEIKIGIACDPRSRLCTHWVTQRQQIIWAHLFVPMSRLAAKKVESIALGMASKAGRRIGISEMFTGLSKADALRCVRDAIVAFHEEEPIRIREEVEKLAKSEAKAKAKAKAAMYADRAAKAKRAARLA